MIEDYKVLHEDASNEIAGLYLLRTKILALAKGGWVLQGGIAVSSHLESDGIPQFQFWQAMVLMSKEHD